MKGRDLLKAEYSKGRCASSSSDVIKYSRKIRRGEAVIRSWD